MVKFAALAIVSSALLATGCGGSDGAISTDRAERQLNGMIQQELADQKAKDVYAGNASCKPTGTEQEWQCWIEIDMLNEEPYPLSGVLSCDGVKCAWRAD